MMTSWTRLPQRRGHTAVHIKYGVPASILAGDVMMIEATKWISEAGKHFNILDLFMTTSRKFVKVKLWIWTIPSSLLLRMNTLR
ncbi:MAG: polyprenyl synthetase family protein [Saprospiraceae bacterium]|nr:polyprenyl synthetase family protein [Saprospiraceae bacterium]